MSIAAVPSYLGPIFSTASPGLRFGMYLQLWGVDHGEDGQGKTPIWTTHDLNWRTTGKDKKPKQFKDENKTACLKNACALTANDKAAFIALGKRQQALAAACGADAMFIMNARSIAPFSTGLGNEHPLENGFAFLNPYGLPYLPGSGVKGVVRQAARELASGEWGDGQGWSKETCYSLEIEKGKSPLALSMLDVLFGYETEAGDKEHVRGTLSFWDVIPQIRGDRLAVDIMTPHQSHYYQNKAAAGSNTPHESGQPNPISFLTVPPKSGFVFHVQCDKACLKRLAPELLKNDRWKTLLEAAFTHAFAWLGFGAKTAVGYGAMQENPEIAKQKQEAREEHLRQHQAETAQRARDALPPDARFLAELDDELAKLPRNPQNQTPIKQATSSQYWQTVFGKLQTLTAQLGDLPASARETLATEAKKRLYEHFKIEGKAEKAVKQQLAALRGQ